MSLELLTRPSLWMETNVSTVAAAMTENGVRTLRLDVCDGDRPLFAMVLIRGKDTQVILDALDAAERALDAEEQGAAS